MRKFLRIAWEVTCQHASVVVRSGLYSWALLFGDVGFAVLVQSFSGLLLFVAAFIQRLFETYWPKKKPARKRRTRRKKAKASVSLEWVIQFGPNGSVD